MASDSALGINTLFGIPIKKSPHLMLPVTIETAHFRSMRERLFTRPWRPHRAVRIEKHTEMRPGIIMVNRNEIYAHPLAVKDLAEAMATHRDEQIVAQIADQMHGRESDLAFVAIEAPRSALFAWQEEMMKAFEAPIYDAANKSFKFAFPMPPAPIIMPKRAYYAGMLDV